MTSPALSVGLPVFNGARFLAASIESVLAQDFPDFELIISDNGSTDGSPEIAARYAARDARVRFFRQAVNRGGAWNYNHVFALSTAPIFKWQAHDDCCRPGLFRACLTALDRAGPGAALAFAETELIDADGARVTDDFLPEPLATREARPHRRLAHVLRHLTMGRPQYGFIRRTALRQTRLYDRFIGSDLVLLGELAVLGEFVAVPDALFQRRIHDGISTRASRDPDALARWWDTSQPGYGHWLPPMLRLGGEFLRSIRRLPLAPADRARCAAVVLWTWNRRELGNLAGRARRRLLARAAPRRVARSASVA